MNKPDPLPTAGRTPCRTRQLVHVAVADARVPMLRGLADMVNGVPGFRADVLVHDGAALLRACNAERPPDAVLLHAELEDGRGVQTVALLHHSRPGLPVLLLCERADAVLAQRAVGAGAAGLLCTTLDDADLCQALRAVQATGFHMNALLRTTLGTHRVDALRGKGRKHHGLTASELRVLVLCADRARYTHREVGRRLEVAQCTVRTHLQHIRAKWKLKTTGAVVRHAMRNGWVN
ncbi:MAG: response regulator [Flavobacteriales bacterium]